MKNLTKSLVLLFYITSFAQNTNEHYTLLELKETFRHENYTNQVLISFQNSMANLQLKPQLHEHIMGDIISWYTINGRFSWQQTYRIQNNEVVEIQTIPNDTIFLNTLNSFVPQKSRFAYGNDLWSFAYVKSKLDDTYYLIKATARSFNARPDIPNDDILSYDIEYKTSDFKNFTLLRFKDIHDKEWTAVNNFNPNYDPKLAIKLGGDDFGMKSYFLVILKTGTNTTTDKDLINQSFRGHLKNINRLVDEEKMVVAGPLGTNEKNYRGIFILDNVKNIEEAHALLRTDPAIENKLLDYDIFNWYGSAVLATYLPFSEKVWKLKP